MEKQDPAPRAAIGTCVPCEVRKSCIDGKDLGIGLFSRVFMDAGTLIWKYNVNEYNEREARKILDSFSNEEDKKLWIEHIFAWKEKIVLLRDDLELINHSQNPNVYFSQKDGNIRVLKKINPGEELLIDYQKLGSYPAFYLKMMKEVGSWFSSRIQPDKTD